MELRGYQNQLYRDIQKAWSVGHRNVLAILPTGGGKTVLFSKIAADNQGPTVVIAHRQELVNQIAKTLAGWGVPHGLLAPTTVIKECVKTQTETLGHSMYRVGARVTVAGVDTLISRAKRLEAWPSTVTLWIQDEAHHVLRNNKWGKAADIFPNARGLGVTATPLRADGKGLGRHADGVMDVLIEGPQMWGLIRVGSLTDYRIFAPPARELHMENVPVTSSGEFSHDKLKRAVQASSIMGDVVEHYKRIAMGKLGVTFVSDVETASDITDRFVRAGVPAAVVTAKTPAVLRGELIRKFARRELLQLVNVALFDEGFDLPAIEVVSMAAPTASYGRYCQRFGRALRPMGGKPHAIIIDHGGDVIRHGLPDAPRAWSLDGRKRKQQESTVRIRVCVECASVYEGYRIQCPYCGYAPEPMIRTGPSEAFGDLAEIHPDVLAKLRGEAARVVRPAVVPQGVGPEVAGAIRKKHRERQEAQEALRHAMAVWGGLQEGLSAREKQRRFFLEFGVDVMTAQTLGRKEAEELKNEIQTK